MHLIQSGPRNCSIMLVGEAPGGTEMKAGTPNQGGAGQLLSHAMSRAGLTMSTCFQTNVLHSIPPMGKFENILKKANQLTYIGGILQLKKDLEEIRPNVVVAMGSHALQPLTGKKGIDKYRGSILPCTLVPGLKVIGTYSPAYALRVYEAKAIIEIDMHRIKAESLSPEIILPQREMILDPNASDRARVRDEMLRAEWLSIDIECWLDANSGKWKLACVGFSDMASRAMVIPATTSDRLLDIRLLLESPTKKVYQNGQFDVVVLQDEGYNVQNFAWDTMMGHHALFTESAGGADEISELKGKKRMSVFKKGLGFQTSIYTREPFYKDDGKLWKETNDLQLFWLYNGRDVSVTREIRDVQDRELEALGTRQTFDHEMELVIPLMYATRRGIKIDQTIRANLRTEYEGEIVNLQNYLDSAAGSSINVKSTPQIMTLLYDKLKLPIKKNRKTGRATGDKDAIIELAEKFQHPMLLTILKIRERRDYLERYISAKLGADGRIRCSFDPTGTRTGRLASRQSLDGSGTNLQNIPARKSVGERIKQMFIADEGKVFVYPDYKQAEVWVVAYLAGARGLIELLNDPTRDVHYENASRIFNKPTTDISDEERYLAKTIVHASNYGMGPANLVQLVARDSETTKIKVSFGRAKELMEKYFMIYPEIREVFWKDVERELQGTRTLTSFTVGRKRAFFARWDDKLIRDAYSYIPQSTVGDLGGRGIINCYKDVQLAKPELEAEFLLGVHDSILMQCNEGQYIATAEAMAKAMAIPLTINGETFVIPTDCKVGRNWGKAGPNNLAGMRDITKGTDGI